MENKIKAILVKIEKEPEVIEMNTELETLQHYVGGYVRCYNFDKGVSILCDEEGKIKGLQEIVITCNPENIASTKTIQKLGCDYIETVDIDPRHELFRMGDVQKEVYVLNLSDNT